MSKRNSSARLARVGNPTVPALRYQFQILNPGAVAELYLPKKAEYQGVLYQTLTEGFEPAKVITHFKRKRTKKHIGHFLKHYAHYLMGIEQKDLADELKKRIKDEKDEKFVPGQSSYLGYSMYEVDGVFRDQEKQQTEEERTQVIRIIFQPDLEVLTGELKKYFQVDPIDVISPNYS